MKTVFIHSLRKCIKNTTRLWNLLACHLQSLAFWSLKVSMNPSGILTINVSIKLCHTYINLKHITPKSLILSSNALFWISFNFDYTRIDSVSFRHYIVWLSLDSQRGRFIIYRSSCQQLNDTCFKLPFHHFSSFWA